MWRILVRIPCVVGIGCSLPCYFPVTGYRGQVANKSGKRPVHFGGTAVFKSGSDLLCLPCGQCIGCRLERSRQWAVRCMHEASFYESNCFITLTFGQFCNVKDGVDPTASLYKFHFQKFMKRLRTAVCRSYSCFSRVSDPAAFKAWSPFIRYMHCGEYGDRFGRPHHHALLFNFDFPDKERVPSSSSFALYRSPLLDSLWPFGLSSIGALTFESAAYVARYVTKKVNGAGAGAHYGSRLPEYSTMSRRPGVGRAWVDEFSKDVYPSDRVVVRGDVECKPPKYYDKVFELLDPVEYASLKERRVDAAKANPSNSLKRLQVRSQVKRLLMKDVKRRYENES